MKFAYLAQGKLYYRDGAQSPRQIESQFAQDVVNRALTRQQKNSWKTGGTSAAAMMARQSMTLDGDVRAIKVRISAIAPGASADELLYVVSTDTVGGLFTYSLSAQKETRVFHKEHLDLSDFRRHPSKDLIACSQRLQNGTATISICQGKDISEVTEGDSSDEAPSWVRNHDKQLVYQSAGVARNQAGYMVGLGPTSLQKLDLQNGTVAAVMEDDHNDYLSPHMMDNGDLFYIRRPYEAPFKRAYPWHKILLDALLLPFRLVRALSDFLNFFSMAFSKKPLTTAGGPKIDGPDERSLLLRGRIIDAEAALKESKQSDDALRLVPASWQLMRRDAGGAEVSVADGVLSYDMSLDGKIIYSTGAAIFQCNHDGSAKELLGKEKFVDTILILE